MEDPQFGVNEPETSVVGPGASGPDSEQSDQTIAFPCRPRLSDYVARYPDIGPEEELPVELVCREYYVRKVGGANPDPDEYVERWEDRYPDLPERLSEVDQSLAERQAGEADTLLVGDTGPEVASDSKPTGGRLGDYELLEELGRGGMGVVYKARQLSLGRTVALKMILSGNFASEQELKRFYAEAETAANLEHPNIVPIHEIGEHAGNHFFSMAFVEGRSLDQMVRENPLPSRKAAEYAKALADAMAHAHAQGVLHRDIKPANVLVDENDQPRLTDFGLAKRIGSDEGLTVTGQILGTPHFMPPEQALGDVKTTGPHSDLYSLGALLFTLLTGRPPFQAPNVSTILMQVANHEPISPRALNPSVDRDLETITLKCLEKDPTRRYASCAELSDELTRFLNNEPINARPISTTGRVWRWCKRKPVIAGMSAAMLLLLLIASIVGYEIRVQGRAVALVERLLDARTTEAPEIIRQMVPYRRRVLPLLREAEADAVGEGESGKRTHIALAILPVDPDQRDYLFAQMLSADPDRFVLIRDAFAAHKDSLVPDLWDVALDTQEADDRRFRAACALADYAPKDARWDEVRSQVAEYLVSVNVLHIGPWTAALRGVRESLLPCLSKIFADTARSEMERSFATTVLQDYAADRPDVLVDLLGAADQEQFIALLPLLKTHGAKAVAELEKELDEEATSVRNDPPLVSERDKDQLASRRANLGVAALRLGVAERLWPLLEHSPDPSTRSYLVHRFVPLAADPENLVDRLYVEPEVSIRRALILAIGEYAPDRLAPAAREQLISKVLEWYRDDPDPGIHGAAEWFLRQWGQEEQALELAPGKPEKGRRWFVNTQGQTMIIIPGPVEFMMGSPQSEEGRSGEERQHRRRIGHTFAIASKEVTVEEFGRFSREIRGQEPPSNKKLSPEERPAQAGLSWYDAAAYCRWLSEKEGIAEDQMCYPPMEEIKEGMKLPSDYLSRNGYRLPTEAEWEYACRAGTSTSRYYGRGAALLGEYAWYGKTSQGGIWPVGSLKPNDFGLFDMYGNACEWCQERQRGYPKGTGGKPVEDVEDTARVSNEVNRTQRGSIFFGGASSVRSAARKFLQPKHHNAYGFRPVIGHGKAPPGVTSPGLAPPLAVAPFDADQAKKHQQVWAEYLGLPVERDFELPGGEKLTMMLIPPGEFMMGSTDEEQARFLEEAEAAKDEFGSSRFPNDDPQHRVRISRPFYLGKYEVTQAQWQTVMGNNPSHFADNVSHPVKQVSWEEVEPFLTKLNTAAVKEEMHFVLPTEAQWEYACRAGTTTYWHCGESEAVLREHGWLCDDTSGRPIGFQCVWSSRHAR